MTQVSTSFRGLRKTAQTVLGIGSICALAGCTSTSVSESLPAGSSAYAVVGAPGAMTPPVYTISPFDVIRISTFNEPGLSFDEVPVDSSGGFSFPFVGRVAAAGMTPLELERELKTRLDARYTRNAQVTIFVKTAASQVFTVEGDVNDPGSYEYAGQTTLLSAIARAGSPTTTAKVEEIVVFRLVNNERYGAVFHLNDIREGRAPDPELFPGDTVVVGYSAIRTGWKEFLSLGPIVNAFTRF
jgi:polysaccharide biosynthesis/export protein